MPAPYCYLGPKSSRTSGPADEIVGEKAKLFRRFQSFENSIPIRIHVKNSDLRSTRCFLFLPSWRGPGRDPGPLSLPTLFFRTGGSTCCTMF